MYVILVRLTVGFIYQSMRLFLICLLLCVNSANAEPSGILAVGDSVLAWHKWTGRDIPSEMGRALGTKVKNAAVPRARFLDFSQSGRRTVQTQYQSGPWDIVLMDGGANDLLAGCRCRDCDAILNLLIDKNLKGAVPEFINRVRSDGVQVVWIGYYASYRSGRFAGCRPYLIEYDARIEKLAKQTSNFLFVDSEFAIDNNDRSLFALDGIHPSSRGTRLIGTFLANALLQ